MKKIKIVKYPDPFLSRPTLNIEDPGSFETMELIKSLFHNLALQKVNGYGLAANQIGVNASVFVTMIQGKKKHYINPCIKEKSGHNGIAEGCYSFAGKIKYTIDRSDVIRVNYTTLLGVSRSEVVDGLESIIIQHEIDHLNGITIYDRWRMQNE